jgi:outer membrane protein OmpU
MKKVLLATSALFLTAGVASAELTFSGTAAAGVYKNGNGAAAADKVFSVYSGIDINIAASATADNGMTFSATTDMGAGSIPDIADKELDAQTDDLTAPEVKIGYNGVTIELQSEGVDDYYDGDLNNYDIGVTGSFGDLSYGLALETDRDEGALTGSTASDDSDYSVTVGYSMAGVSVTVNSNQTTGGDKTALILGYTMGDLALKVTADNKGSAKDVTTIAATYTAGPAKITLSGANDKDNNSNKNNRQSWDMSVAYTTGAYTINASTNESDAWEADVAYDLGGGATLNVATDSNDTVIAGVSFAF